MVILYTFGLESKQILLEILVNCKRGIEHFNILYLPTTKLGRLYIVQQLCLSLCFFEHENTIYFVISWLQNIFFVSCDISKEICKF